MTFWQEVFYSVPAISPAAVILRGLFTYVWLLAFVRLMGQRELGRLTVFDGVVAITVGTIAAFPVTQPQVSLLMPLLGIAAWSLAHLGTSVAGNYWPAWRRVAAGEPVVLVKDGKLLEENLSASRLTMDDLMSELRLRGVPRLQDVEFAVLEPRGRISVFRRAETQPASRADLKLPAEHTGLPTFVILDGRILYDNLKDSGFSEAWLKDRLRRENIKDVREVKAAQLDAAGSLYVDRYDDDLPAPRSRREPALVARLKRAAAELQQFALDTQDQGARKTYTATARQVRDVLERLEPRLETPEQTAAGWLDPTVEQKREQGAQSAERWVPGDRPRRHRGGRKRGG